MQARGGGRDPSEFLLSFVNMANSDLSYLERMERVEVIMNSVKVLRILTQEADSAQKVLKGYPNLLFDAKEFFKDFLSNQVVRSEAAGLVYNVKVNNGRMPNELTSLLRGFDPQQYIV